MLFKTVLVILLYVSGVWGQNGWGVTYAPETICGLKGSSVDMHCSYSYPKSHSVQKTFWFIHQNPTQEPKDLSLDQEYSDRVEYLGNRNNDCTFRIKQLRESDSKTYHFRFLTYNADGRYSGEPGVTLDVTALQVIMYPDTVTEGQSVTLTCSTTCTLTGLPAFTWYRDGSPLSFTTQTHQLTASSEDRGRYSCAVKGYKDLPSLVVALTVNYPPKSVAVLVSPSAEIEGGSSVTLTCSSDANPPVNSYTWYQDNTRLRTIYGQTNTIAKFTYSNTGEYFCKVWNGIGTVSFPPILLYLKLLCLKFKITPNSFTEGEMVTLTCENNCPYGYRSSIEFRKNGQRLSKYNPKKFSARSEDAGNYSCGLSYYKHSSSNVVFLQEKYPPQGTTVSVSGEIVEGSSVTLTCSSDANPPVNRYTWLKGNRAVSSETEGPEASYTIKHITQQDAGEYYCEARNWIGTYRSPPKLLDVQYSPKNTSISVSHSGEIMEGSSVNLTCSSDANPPVQNYTWFKKNKTRVWQAGSGQSLNFPYLQSWNRGWYYCVSENKHGAKNSAAVSLKVYYAPKNTSVSLSPSGEIMEGISVTLTCSSDANPPVQNYTWFKKNRAVSSWRKSGLNHSITNIVSQESGQYYCEVQNQLGTQNSTTETINVQYPPKNTSVSVSPSGEIVEGSSVILTCSSDANPPVQNYTWFKKNETGVWQAGSGQSLTLSNFESWNSGHYYCLSQNKHGAQNSTALLATAQGGQTVAVAVPAAVGVGAIVALVFLGVVWVRRRTSETGHTEGDREGNKGPIYGNVSGTPMSHNQEELLYSTVCCPQSEDEVQYASVQFLPSGAGPRPPASTVTEECVLYSTVQKHQT
ncbi:B-cell receptor CD22-like isoform X2 [Conger conger]|uniref:B-cell receptor CD22-like isoform X2 n=1 Tax=Conger conger TaxID=82655 RepID=UPI002A5A04F6|nr:B-cell receptor CD22-like isoform X2 [Conger conger]